MAEMRVGIDGASSTALPTAPANTSATPIYITTVTNPSIKGSYVFSIGDVAGVAAANNFLTLYNPVGSGKTISLGAAYASSYSTAASAPTVDVNVFRATAVSGGTLQTNSTALAKFQTAMPASIAEVRTGNPAATVGAQIANIPPSQGAFVTDQFVAAAPAVYPPFTLAEGEGVVWRQTAAGVTTTHWNFSVVWAEI